jgi:hypothetical protein
MGSGESEVTVELDLYKGGGASESTSQGLGVDGEELMGVDMSIGS